MLRLTKEELKSYQDAKECYICEKGIQKNAKDINYRKVRNHCNYAGKYGSVAYGICNLRFKA